MLKICSFNCHSLKSSLEEVKSLCNQCDIIFLQETWLASFELTILNSIHDDFVGMGKTAMDSSAGLLKGRPFGGLAILWKKSLQSCVKVIALDKRIMCLHIQTSEGVVSLLNVYLPTDYGDYDSLDEFGMCLGHLSSALEQQSQISSLLGVLGDFNANCRGSRFFCELLDFCADLGLIVSDINFIGPSNDNFTFVSAAHGSTSWLDHCLCSPSLHNLLQSVEIRFDVCTDDH